MRKPSPAIIQNRRESTRGPRQAAVAAERRSMPPSLRDTAYEAIKHRIITCEFKPGEHVNEARLSADLELGRTPVHQAIERLMLEGMVEVIPRKGVIVKPISFDEVIQIIEARLVIEPQAIRLATERADQTDIASLKDALDEAQEWTAAHNVEQIMLLDRKFHVLLARGTRNDVFADILRRLHERSLRFWFISLTDTSHHKAVQDEHRAILEEISSRNVEAAEVAMRRHIESFRGNVVRYL